jgi:hypothetical protein
VQEENDGDATSQRASKRMVMVIGWSRQQLLSIAPNKRHVLEARFAECRK